MAVRNITLELPRDLDSHPVQALRPGTSITIAVSNVTARVAIPTGASALMLSCTEACWFKFGDVTVTATASGADSVLHPGGCLIIIVPTDATYVAAIRQSADGPLCVTKME